MLAIDLDPSPRPARIWSGRSGEEEEPEDDPTLSPAPIAFSRPSPAGIPGTSAWPS